MRSRTYPASALASARLGACAPKMSEPGRMNASKPGSADRSGLTSALPSAAEGAARYACSIRSSTAVSASAFAAR